MSHEPYTLVDLARARAETHPDRGYRFLGDDGSVVESLSYADLDRSARAIAARVIDRGARAGDAALLVYPPGLDFIRAFWACFYAGIIAVPTPTPNATKLPRLIARLRAIAVDSRARFVLTSSIESNALREVFASSPELARLTTIATDKIDDDPKGWKEPTSSGEAAAILQYTSGSTRDPRGVVTTHANLLHNLTMLKEFHLDQEHMVMISWLPLHHDMGLIRGMMSPLHMGGDCFLMTPMSFVQRPARWLEAVTTYAGTTIGAPNFGFELCTRKIDESILHRLDLSTLRVAFCSAEPILKATVDRFIARFSRCGLQRSAFRPAYGLAEATVMVTGELGDGPAFVGLSKSELRSGRVVLDEGDDTQHLTSCGAPLGGQEIVIVDENGRRSPADHIGEIWVRGPSVARGYLGKESETSEVFAAHLADGAGPFLKTGDLGFSLPNGGLCVVGRLRDLIIVRGQNYHPHEIETTVERIAPYLRAGCSAAFGVERDGTEGVVVLCELSGKNGDFDFDSMVRDVRSAVSEEHDLALDAIYVLPKGGVPKTTSGKVQRSLARHLYSNSEIRPTHAWVDARRQA